MVSERYNGMSRGNSLGGQPPARGMSRYKGLIFKEASKMMPRGFTAIELLLVAVLILTVTGMALPWIPGVIQAYRLRVAAWDLAGDLRLARQKAVSTQVRHRVCFAECGNPKGNTPVPNPGYVVEREDGADNWRLDFTVDFSRQLLGTAINIDPPTENTVVFNARGTSGPGTVTLANPSGKYKVVTAQTGRVRVCRGSC